MTAGAATKGAHHDEFGSGGAVLHDFENGFPQPPGAAADMPQQEAAAAEQKAAPPTV
jgi:hypothetical protein